MNQCKLIEDDYGDWYVGLILDGKRYEIPVQSILALVAGDSMKLENLVRKVTELTGAVVHITAFLNRWRLNYYVKGEMQTLVGPNIEELLLEVISTLENGKEV